MAMPRPPILPAQTTCFLPLLFTHRGLGGNGSGFPRELGLKSGTLYPLLMRLSDQGLLDARWQDSSQPGRPPRHMYRPTAAGLALAREQRSTGSLRGLLSKRLNLGS